MGCVTERKDTMDLLDQAALRIHRYDPARRAGWVVYILEVLQDGVDPDTYEDMLERVRDGINERLEEGSW